MTTNRTKWYESSPGNTSSTRIFSGIWLVFVAAPLTYFITFAMIEIWVSATLVMDWKEAVTAILLILIINLIWIAPKTLKNMAEESGILSKFLAGMIPENKPKE